MATFSTVFHVRNYSSGDKPNSTYWSMKMADTKTQQPVHTEQPPNAPGPEPGTPERPTEKPPVKPNVPKQG